MLDGRHLTELALSEVKLR